MGVGARVDVVWVGQGTRGWQQAGQRRRAAGSGGAPKKTALSRRIVGALMVVPTAHPGPGRAGRERRRLELVQTPWLLALGLPRDSTMQLDVDAMR